MGAFDNLWIRGQINLIAVTGLQDGLDGAYVNNATIEVTVTTLAGANLTGAGVSWPLVLDYVAASNGNYNGSVPAAADVSGLNCVVVSVVAKIGNTVIAQWDLKQNVIDRE